MDRLKAQSLLVQFSVALLRWSGRSWEQELGAEVGAALMPLLIGAHKQWLARLHGVVGGFQCMKQGARAEHVW